MDGWSRRLGQGSELQCLCSHLLFHSSELVGGEAREAGMKGTNSADTDRAY